MYDFFIRQPPLETPVFQPGEERGVPFLVAWEVGVCARGTSRVLQRKSLMGRQSLTLAVWVSRLFVCGSCKLSLPSIVPPMAAFPHLGCCTNVPRFIPRESVPP